MTISKIILAGVLSAAMLPAAAHANLFSDMSFHAILGYHVYSKDSALGNQSTESRYRMTNAPIFGLRIAYPLLHWLGIELELPVAVTNAKDDIEATEDASLFFASPRLQLRTDLQLGASEFTLFASGGGGLPFITSNNQSAFENDVQLAIIGSVGIRYERPEGLGIRLEFRGTGINGRIEQSIVPEFEFLISFFRSPRRVPSAKQEPLEFAKAPAVTPKTSNPDWDNDGILNEQDKCPDKAEDKDGFQDADGCPDTDNDLDQVSDANDKCPSAVETRNGFADEDGCPDVVPKAVLALQGIIHVPFSSKDATNLPRRRSIRSLNKVAAVLNKYPSVLFEISGHTDNHGDPSDNEAISLGRAESVKDYLVRKGVSEDRLVTAGLGSQKPISSNDSKEGRAKNRRIELKFLTPTQPSQAEEEPEPEEEIKFEDE